MPETETPSNWHDGCPRCPHCGKHRHAGYCGSLWDSLYRVAALMDEAADHA